MLILNVIQGPDKGKSFELPDNEPQLIGRSSEALPLGDLTISRRHAELTPDEGNWIINDLRSANGTYVNGIRIEAPYLLNPGDQIRTGATIFVFGRTRPKKASSVRMVRQDQLEASVEKVIASNDDSVVLAVPEPSAQAVQQLSVLYEMMQLTGSIFDRKELLGRVMDLVFEHFEADRGFVLLQSDPEQRPEPFMIRYRQTPTSYAQERIMVSRTIVQHVMSRREGVLSSNAMTDKRFASGESVQAYGIRSAICVPLQFRDRLFGVIHIDSQVANYTFTEDQLRLMTAIGAQTGLALANAELYQQGLIQARLAAVGETVANLSHSIKNILQGMRGGAEVIELGIRREDLKVINNGWDILSRNLERIYDLSMNMLAYSKQRQPEMEMVNLPSLIGECIELVKVQCDRKKVALLTEIESDMPPIPADPSGLHQAIMNLLINAIDAVPSKDGVITLRVEYDSARSQVNISVADNGSGIQAEQWDQIFQPFYSTKGLRGTGLGLAVTKKIVEEHRGRIDLETAVGEGTTFRITISTDQSVDPSATQGAAAKTVEFPES